MSQAITIHFKHTIVDKVKNLFRPKAKRFPDVAVFKGVVIGYVGEGCLNISFDHQTYYRYPLHTIKRIKVE